MTKLPLSIFRFEVMVQLTQEGLRGLLRFPSEVTSDLNYYMIL